MSNYTQTTFFTPKDSLPITDPNKTIFGAAYDVEFANISAAFVTKLDSVFVNPALISLSITGAATPTNGFALPSANTLGIYTNSTQRATVNSFGSWNILATGQGIATLTVNCNDNSPALTLTDVGPFVSGLALSMGISGTQYLTLGVGSNLGAGVTSTNSGIVSTGSLTLSNTGVIVGAPTGGAQGSGTLNATALFINGVSVNAAGQFFTAAQSAASMSVGQSIVISRTTTANVTSNAVPANDAVLQFTALANGTYFFEVWANFSSTSATPGVSFSLQYTGTATNAPRWYSASTNVTNTTPAISNLAFATAQTETLGVSLMSTIYANTTLVSSATGVLSFQWAQAVSNATATTIGIGSYCRLTRLS